MLKFIALIIGIYGLMCGLLYVKQRGMLYFPTAEVERAETRSFWFERADARLKIWQLNAGAPAILYFGGNAESVDGNIDAFRTWFAGYTVYLVNYRGYGGSSGQPTESALVGDALALFDHLSGEHSRIHVIGRSLGSGVAVQLAAQRPVGRLVLITPFDSIENVASRHYPLFPVRWLIKDRFDSLAVAGDLKNPVLAIIAEGDRVIPSEHSLNLVATLDRAEVEVISLQQASHNDVMGYRQSQRAIQDFLPTPKAIPR
jgi:hypothetical protein